MAAVAAAATAAAIAAAAKAGPELTGESKSYKVRKKEWKEKQMSLTIRLKKGGFPRRERKKTRGSRKGLL